MTQQDDITQRVLTDDEIQALWDEACKDSPQAPGWNRHIRYGRAIESALLSKLRAPVADERAQHDNWYSRTHMHEYSRDATWRGWQARAALASAPVAGEAQGVSVERLAKDPFLAAQLWRNPVDRAPVAGEAQPVIHQHGFASDNQKLRAINESLDEQLEEVMAERDDYHDWADELSEAIAAHLGVEIGEHSSSNLPWLRALDAIKNAAPQASEDGEHGE